MSNTPFSQTWSNGSTSFRVLMADPDASLAAAYRERLSQEDIELITATSGLECLARLRECVPDVLVLELHMPWGGGDGVLALIDEELPQLATVPVMVLTSCSDPDAMRGIERVPISDYHVKPLAPDRLAETLRNLVAHPRRRFTLAERTGRPERAVAGRHATCVRDLRVDAVDGRIHCASTLQLGQGQTLS